MKTVWPNVNIPSHILASLIMAPKSLPIILVSLLIALNPCLSESGDTPKAADLVQDNQPIDIATSGYTKLFDELETEYHFSRRELIDLFSGLRIKRRVLELMDKQWEAKPYYDYRPLFVTPAVIERGKKNLVVHQELFDRIENQFGVNREVIVAIWGIESRFGSNQGGFELFRSLNTLFSAYPRRSDFFRKELIQFLILCRDNGIDPLTVHGSYAGAFGQAQFMPSSFNAYGVDYDGDQKVDLINSLPDIFASIAHYLQRFGWTFGGPVYADLGRSLKTKQLNVLATLELKGTIGWRELSGEQELQIPRPSGNGQLSVIGLERSPFEGGGFRYVALYPNFRTITKYNHSTKYGMAVSEMAEAFLQ